MPPLFRLGVLKLFKHVFEYFMAISPPPTPPRAILFSLSGWSAVTFMRQTWRSLPDYRSCRSENQNTSVILPPRWSSYVIWFVLHIPVEAWVAQVISFGGIDKGNSNTSCSAWIDRFHLTSHHFRSAILVYHFRLRNPRNFSTTIIPTSKMDSKEKEKESQNKSGVDYSFPISEYAKQLDFPVRDRYLLKIAAIGIDPVLVEGKDFKGELKSKFM